MKYTVIGITDNPQPYFPPDVMAIIKQGRVFSGGKRHHEIIGPMLPENAKWIDITVPLQSVFDQYAKEEDAIIVFASGDPLFFGFANTIRRLQPEAMMEVYPSFHSLQKLAHKLLLPYHDMHHVSLTGRPWPALDRALIEGIPMIGVLTDKNHTPAAIAQRLLEYGFNDYHMWVGEHLGNPEKERISSLFLEEAAVKSFELPNCLILKGNHTKRFGIPDEEFMLLDGRKRMITKMPIRLLSLQALDLTSKTCLWDVGFCTGSLSIETRLSFPHLDIHSFEIRPEGKKLITANARKFHAPGINSYIGDFLQQDISALPHPDAVFIGGHGGRLNEMMHKVFNVLSPGGCIVMNSVTAESKEAFESSCRQLGLHLLPSTHIVLNDFNPIDILKCTK